MKFMYMTDQDVRAAYLAEFETVIQFQLIILQNARTLQEIEKQYLFKFIKAKRAELYLVGINFQVSNSDSVALRYAAALNEIRRLTPDKQTLFNALKDFYIEEQRNKAIEEEMAEQREQERAEARLQALGNMDAERRAKFAEMDKNPNMPIDEMPDCY